MMLGSNTPLHDALSRQPDTALFALVGAILIPEHAYIGFSLSALEETMQENKRLSNSAAQSASRSLRKKVLLFCNEELAYWLCQCSTLCCA